MTRDELTGALLGEGFDLIEAGPWFSSQDTWLGHRHIDGVDVHVTAVLDRGMATVRARAWRVYPTRTEGPEVTAGVLLAEVPRAMRALEAAALAAETAYTNAMAGVEVRA